MGPERRAELLGGRRAPLSGHGASVAHRFHVYDASVHGGRHVFPAVRPLYDVSSLPVPLVIQPAVKTGKDTRALRVAQAWENDLWGGAFRR